MPVDKQFQPAKHVNCNGHSNQFSSNDYENFETPNRNKMAYFANPKSPFNLMMHGNLWQPIIEAYFRQ
ncbi:MAG: hypothetical protein J0L55_15545 [Caulobacterales bacterium]|nr:hypothetical protein [Caulobacterales bacterium]